MLFPKSSNKPCSKLSGTVSIMLRCTVGCLYSDLILNVSKIQRVLLFSIQIESKYTCHCAVELLLSFIT